MTRDDVDGRPIRSPSTATSSPAEGPTTEASGAPRRIVDNRDEPVRSRPGPREGGEVAEPVHVSFLIDRSGIHARPAERRRGRLQRVRGRAAREGGRMHLDPDPVRQQRPPRNHSRFSRHPAGSRPGRRTFGEIRDYLPNRHARHRPVGLPSDDTQLAFWTLEHLVDHRGLSPTDSRRCSLLPSAGSSESEAPCGSFGTPCAQGCRGGKHRRIPQGTARSCGSRR